MMRNKRVKSHDAMFLLRNDVSGFSENTWRCQGIIRVIILCKIFLFYVLTYCHFFIILYQKYFFFNRKFSVNIIMYFVPFFSL